jgi:hypothetical protein
MGQRRSVSGKTAKPQGQGQGQNPLHSWQTTLIVKQILVSVGKIFQGESRNSG